MNGTIRLRKKPGSGRGERELRTRVKTAKGRSASSAKWLDRQLNDPYVHRARREGWRGRAAFKLLEIDDRYNFLKPGAVVLDLGCAPGGWCQVAAQRVNALKSRQTARAGRVFGVDINETEPVEGAEIRIMDVQSPNAADQLLNWLQTPADVVLSDMAAPSIGHKKTDYLRTAALAEAAADVACRLLSPGGVFIAKMLGSGADSALQARLKQSFRRTRHCKPPASRSSSSESYLFASGFRLSTATAVEFLKVHHIFDGQEL